IEAHQWGNAWNNGIYPYHHYHSTAHEVLFICHGKATIQFGGPNGQVQTVRAGDVVEVPAGVAHNRLDTDPDLVVIGAYPKGQSPDMCLGEPEERPDTDQNIESVPLPAQDPVYGEEGPMMRYWRQPQSL
ncbi:MAG: cupin domain-containing protein, partial [Phycisphaeraceae bacterium]|nr:cupin domain-containing protein [Phycisphaeraceae bacterium]